MSVKSPQYFKDKFKTGYKITELDYADWLDSFRHVQDPLFIQDLSGLNALLDNYRKKNIDIPAAEISGLSQFIAALLTNYLTTTSQIPQVQVTDLEESLQNRPTVPEVESLIDIALGMIALPTIGANGNWYIGNEDTGRKAIGEKGDPGETPTIGENGNWYINDMDTSFRAVDMTETFYDDQITGVRGESNQVFTIPKAYRKGSVILWIDGMRMTPGNGSKDFMELDDNDRAIRVNGVVAYGQRLIIEIQKKTL